jgi:hypothetical protein
MMVNYLIIPSQRAKATINSFGHFEVAGRVGVDLRAIAGHFAIIIGSILVRDAAIFPEVDDGEVVIFA